MANENMGNNQFNKANVEDNSANNENNEASLNKHEVRHKFQHNGAQHNHDANKHDYSKQHHNTQQKNQEEDEIDKKDLKIKQLEDQLLRTVAELQNFQKRSEKEKADIANFGITKFAKDVLMIFDSLQLALNSCNKNSVPENADPIVEGIKLTLDQIHKVFANYGIKIIESMNHKFNPNYHQAISQEEADKESGTIIKVMQEGFMIKDRLLRPALVTVAK